MMRMRANSLILCFLLSIATGPALSIGYECKPLYMPCSAFKDAIDKPKPCDEIPSADAEMWLMPKFEGKQCTVACPEINEIFDECILEKGKNTPKHFRSILVRSCKRDACQAED